jgi:Transposase
MVPSEKPSSPVDPSSFQYVVGIDIGSQTCSFCVLKPDKSQVVKPTKFANHADGFTLLRERLERLDASAAQILIGLEATSRYGENLYRFLEGQGYQLCLLHPRQTHQFAEQRGLRAKTDHLDATTIGRVLLSGEARRGYVPSEEIATRAPNWCDCIPNSPTIFLATKTRFMPCSRSCFRSLLRCLPILLAQQPLVCSNVIQVRKRWLRLA